MVRVGIIGTGFGRYGLLPAFKSTNGCKVVFIANKKNWREKLEKEKIDALAFAVPPQAQYEIAKIAIRKGLHVFAEKPLAVTYKQAKELFDLAQKKKVKHVVDFMFLEIEEWKKVKELIDKKTYGELQHVSLSWNFQGYDIKNKISSWKTDVSKGGGALSFYFSHSLYYLEQLAGPITKVKSLFSYSKESLNGGEVGVDLLLKFKTNATGYAHLRCDTVGFRKHQLLFVFEKATVMLENENSVASNFSIKIFTEGKVKRLSVSASSFAQELRKDKSRGGGDERVKTVRKLTTKFIDSIIKDKKVIPSFKEGMRVQELIEKIRKEQVL